MRNGVAIAEAGRKGEVRFFAEVDASAANMRRIMVRIASQFDHVHVCYEAGSIGCAPYRLSGRSATNARWWAILDPKKPGDRVEPPGRPFLSSGCCAPTNWRRYGFPRKARMRCEISLFCGNVRAAQDLSSSKPYQYTFSSD